MFRFFEKEGITLEWLPAHTVLQSARKTISIEISPEKGLIIRIPKRISFAQLYTFLEEKKSWILKKEALAKERKKTRESLRKGEKTLFFMGTSYPLRFLENETELFFFDGEQFFALNQELLTRHRAIQKWYSIEMEKYCKEKVPILAQAMGVSFSVIKVSNAKKRWGSCSHDGTLSFAWRLLMAPEKIIDYVIVHELAHRKEMNHSRKFWKVVEAFCPEYKSHRKWLRENGHLFSVE